MIRNKGTNNDKMKGKRQENKYKEEQESGQRVIKIYIHV